jgi:hypothetical protein
VTAPGHPVNLTLGGLALPLKRIFREWVAESASRAPSGNFGTPSAKHRCKLETKFSFTERVHVLKTLQLGDTSTQRDGTERWNVYRLSDRIFELGTPC